MLALHADRPVKIVYNRESRSRATSTGTRQDPGRASRDPRRRIVCVHMRILVDGGAYASSSTAVISNASAFAIGPYRVDNALIEGTAVYANNPPCGAMRGFGAVQVCFARGADGQAGRALGIDRSSSAC
jgi:CO/xanthine dehydrogenase Mo-binding subunit